MLGVRWEAVELAPLKDAALKKPKEFPFLGEDLVLKRPFSQNTNFRWEKIREQGSGQDPVIGSGIEGCGAEFGPAFAAACWRVISIAVLWLHRMSTTEACLVKIVLKDGR